MDHPEEGERKSWGYLPIFLTRDATPASAHLLSSLMLESVRESYPFTELRMPRCASCFSAQLFVLLLRHCRGWQRVRDGFFVNFPFFRVTQFYKCAGQQLLYLEKRSVCACGDGWVGGGAVGYILLECIWNSWHLRCSMTQIFTHIVGLIIDCP